MIPKILHFIWIGDETKRPDNCIESWCALHPDWEVRIWGNRELQETDWINQAHMAAMYDRELNGVADMMRWEILYKHGGLLVDADSICVRRLDDHLLDCEAFACWESEIARPGMIAAGYFASEAGTPFLGRIIADIEAEPSVINEMAWKTVGPERLTDAYRKYAYSALRIYPSHYFIPRHFSGVAYNGRDPVYAHQLWGSTLSGYDDIHRQDIQAAVRDVAPAAPAVPDSRSIAVGPAALPARPQAAQGDTSPLAALHQPYFVQSITVSDEIAELSRLEVFRYLCEGKRVLHVGCADWPITDPATSLHLALEPYCTALDGVDVHVEALDQLAPYAKGRLFSSLEQADGRYDVVLVPEVLEHVPNVATFMEQLQSIDADCFLISVPDAYQCQGGHFDFVQKSQTFVEIVHPDHNVWYTPYTFSNTLQKYSDLVLERMWFFNRISLLALLSKQSAALAA